MAGKGAAGMSMAFVNATAAAFTRTYSPISLSQNWSKVSRLIFMVIISTIGIILNGFFIAAFFVEKKLNKKGNVFLALVGMADFLITAGVMPMSAVVLLSGQWDNPDVCHALQFIAEVSTYTFSIFFMLAVMENFCQLGCSPTFTRRFVNLAVNPGIIVVYAGTITSAAYGVYKKYDYDYCQRLHHGDFDFRAYTAIFFHFIPCVCTITILLITTLYVRKRGTDQLVYRRSRSYDDDYCKSVVNIVTYFLYVSAWTPYLIILFRFPDTSDSKFYNCAWMALCRSTITSVFYWTLNRDFRQAYRYLCNYCFCKTSLPGAYYSRNRRTTNVAGRDVSVHILNEALSPQRPAPRSPETLEL